MTTENVQPVQTSDNLVKVEEAIQMVVMLLSENKPNDRSEIDRLWAIARTDAEKLLAFWYYLKMR